MPGFFSRLKGNNGPPKAKRVAPHTTQPQLPVKKKWEDAWTRKSVEPEEVQELLRGCTLELKAKALDVPFLLLPFRPTSDPSAARTFIRNYFENVDHLRGDHLAQELRLTEPMVLCSVAKWCWSRLAGGVVTWEAYELFRIGEHDSKQARDSFATFIPLSVDTDARREIIFDFFDLLSAIAAHSKSNGLGGRKLSRLAGWWAFEHTDRGKGFDGGYKDWAAAADATSHLFFAYLRSLSPESTSALSGISSLPRSLQKLLQETEYPPEAPTLLQVRTSKLVMVVETVSPTPFALLRRANHFEYRDEDRALQEFADYEDPVQALSDECRRVLNSISSTNQSQVSTSKQSTGLRDASWSRFEDIGFSGNFDEADEDSGVDGSFLNSRRLKEPQGLRTSPTSQTLDLGRPTTPSWADFLNAGFVDDGARGPSPLLLPPDKILPPIDTSRGRSSQSHRQDRTDAEQNLDPGELANITKFDLDDAFWWVWISSLAGEETTERKAVFGRCALVETVIKGGRWLVMEEIIRGAAPEPAVGAYVAEKKSRFGWTKRGKDKNRRMSVGKDVSRETSLRAPYKIPESVATSKTSIGPDQHARIQAAAAQLQKRQYEQSRQQASGARRGRTEELSAQKTSTVFSLQPVIVSEATPAMKWASKYDKDAIREAYLANSEAGRGESPAFQNSSNGHTYGSVPAGEPSTEVRSQALPSAPLDVSSQDTEEFLPSQVEAPAPMPDEEPVVAEASTPARKPLPTDASPYHEPEQVDSKRVIEPEHSQIPHTPIDDIGMVPYEHLAENGSPPPTMVATLPKPAEREKSGKLQKKNPSTRGFRKMFGRSKIREPQQKVAPTSSGVSAGAHAAALAAMNASQKTAPAASAPTRRFASIRKKSPTVSSAADAASYKSASIAANEPTATASQIDEQHDTYHHDDPHHVAQTASYAPSEQETLSRVDTNDAQEAHQAFSSFDQGPLDHMPAFVPDSAISSPRHSEDAAPAPSVPRGPTGGGYDEAPAMDRWAQIRKNAAERAAQRQAAADNDGGETSEEEPIEKRVAKIKARIAKMTTNMEGTTPTRP